MAEQTTPATPTDATAIDPTEVAIDPDELATCLRVLEQAGQLDKEHPDSVTVQRAVARDAISEADRQVVAATAAGSPNRA